MGTAAVKMKFMPSSLESSLEEIKTKIEEILNSEDVPHSSFEEEPVAFGLKALIATFGWPEEKELEPLEKRFSEIENVNSVELIDIRRAIG